jgi:hypothetical protein
MYFWKKQWYFVWVVLKKRVVYRDGSSRISGEASGGSYRKRPWPEVTWPEATSTGNDVTWSGPDRKWRHGSDRVRMRNRFPHFFLTIVVVQNVPLHITIMATGSNRKSRDPKALHWKDARMSNRKLRNIRLSWAFWLEMMSSNVTPSASYLSFSSAFTGYLPLSRHFISAFNNYTTKVCCFRICSVVL